MRALADNLTEQRIDKPTPNGGDYSIIYYQDADGNSITKDKAQKAEAVEFNSTGKEIFRTYLTKAQEA